MGDRATFVIEQNEATPDSPASVLYLYGHWAGDGMMNELAQALIAAEGRLAMDDEVYSARIIISQIIGNSWQQETGWGLSTYFCDSEHSVPVVNLTNKTVRLLPHKWDTKFDIHAEPKFVMSIDSFIAKFAKSLVPV